MAEIWKSDSVHSELEFRVKHLMISIVSGTFREFEVTVETENGNFDQAKIHFAANAASIDTRVADRDAHLKSADFFDAATYPTIRFESRSFTHTNGHSYRLEGDLTIRNVTLPIQLNATYEGGVTDGEGKSRVGFEVSGKLDRKAYGLTWNTITEAGGMLVGEEVKLFASLELVKTA